MVRSPASASRKRRIDSSSSEELEDVSMRSPRKSSKLRKMSLASPESSIDNDGARELLEDGEGEEEQPALENDGSGSNSSNASQEVGDDEDDAEYQEKLQIWEMFADEYHDIVRELPRELQRSFQLMLEHDEQMRAHQQALQTATKEYLHLAKSDAYQDAMIKSQLARKMAANLGGPETIIQPTQPSYSAFSNAQSAATLPPVGIVNPAVASENGGVANDNNGEHASNISEEEVQTALVRSASPAKTREPSLAPVAVDATGDTEEEEDPADHMRKLLGDIVNHSRAAIKAGDDKVALAVSAYNWVDRHLNRLDADLAKQEEALSLGLRPGTQPSTDAREAQAHAYENAETAHLQDAAGLPGGGKGALPYDSHVHRNKQSPSRKKNKRKSKSASVAPSHEVSFVLTSEANEEKYCYCQQGSSDTMIGCDNPQCRFQWFHLHCLNLTAPPEVEPWFCPECAPLMQKKQPKKKKPSKR